MLIMLNMTGKPFVTDESNSIFAVAAVDFYVLDFVSNVLISTNAKRIWRYYLKDYRIEEYTNIINVIFSLKLQLD